MSHYVDERSFIMAKHKVEISNLNTSNIKVLTSKEMDELFVKMRNGDPFARDDLVQGNLKLVLSILKKFNKKNENMDDLFQIGCVGLLKAIDNFDLSYGVKFSTYCVPMIQGEVRRYLRDNNSIRVSRSVKDLAYKSIQIKDEELLEKGREPDTKFIAEKLGVEEFEVINALSAMRDPVSIFEPIYNFIYEANFFLLYWQVMYWFFYFIFYYWLLYNYFFYFLLN